MRKSLSVERASPKDMTSDEFQLNLSRYVFAKKHVRRNSTVLEIAVGDGYGLPLLRDAKLVVAADISKNALKKARNYVRNMQYIRCDAQFLPFRDRAFDLITSFETIEHLHFPKRFLSELNRVSTPNAKIILSTPNTEYKMPWIRDVRS